MIINNGWEKLPMKGTHYARYKKGSKTIFANEGKHGKFQIYVNKSPISLKWFDDVKEAKKYIINYIEKN